METLPQAWAQLVSTSENQSEPVEIKKNKFVIGRSTGKLKLILTLKSKLIT